MKVGNRQQFGLASGEPFRSRRPLTLRAMAVSARVVGDAGEPAIVAALDMTAERRRAAGRDRSDHAPFDAPEMSGVRSFVTVAVAAKHVGQFERRPNPHRTILAASRSARVYRASTANSLRLTVHGDCNPRANWKRSVSRIPSR